MVPPSANRSDISSDTEDKGTCDFICRPCHNPAQLRYPRDWSLVRLSPQVAEMEFRKHFGRGAHSRLCYSQLIGCKRPFVLA